MPNASLQAGRRIRGVFSEPAVYGFALALLAVLTVMVAGLGSRWGWWHFRTGFTILTWGVYGGLAAVMVSFVGLLWAAIWYSPRGLLLGGAGLLIGLLSVGVPWNWLQTAKRVPPIHDITTDTENPPRFVAILPLRKDAPNPADYGGPEVAAQQHTGYPNLGPAMVSLPPPAAFEHAREVAHTMGWEMIEANAAEGRIEATDTTFWFGFKDDIIIRIIPADGGSRVDLRSVSRVGGSDVGTNAKRIRKYLERLKMALRFP